MRRHRLVESRKRRGWTQEETAQKLKITTGFYGMLEQGTRNPRLPLAFSLEKLFGIPLKQLFPDLFSAVEAERDVVDHEICAGVVNQ